MGKKRVHSASERDEQPLAKANRTGEMIVDQLNSKNAIEALKGIAEASDNEDIVKLLSQGGNGKDLLSIFVNSAEKLKSPEISIVFNACEKFLLHVTTCMLESSTPEEASKFTNFGIELCREILEDHLGYIILLLSGTNTAYQVKSSLRLLTAMVTCCGQTAKEVLLKLDFEHKNWESVVKRQSSDIRSAFVQFLMSFFVINNAGVAKEFIEKRQLISSILPGLVKDDSELVLLVMAWFKEKVLENPSISKTAKMKLFSVNNLKHLLGLFQWKGPAKEEEVSTEAKELVLESAMEFFKVALTSSKSGLIFNDLSYGTSGSNLNLLMLNLIQSIAEPWKRPQLAKVVVDALGACPDQLRPYIIRQLQPLWHPRHSESWFQVVDFIFAIMEKLDVLKIIQDLTHKNKLLTTVISNFLCNEKIFKEVILECIKVEDALVKLKGVELLGLFLNKLTLVMKCDQIPPSVKKQVLFRLHDKIPSLGSILNVWNNEATKAIIEVEEQEMATPESTCNYLLVTTQAISFYLSYFPDKYTTSDLDIQAMLQKIGHSNLDKDGLVQLLLLKHLMSSHGTLSTNDQHLTTLVTIACKYLDDENGALALEALYSLLAKHDLCFRPEDLKVWFAFVSVDKIDKVGKLLSQEIGELLANHDLVIDEIKKELQALQGPCSSDSFHEQDLIEKLMSPGHKTDEDIVNPMTFSVSPTTWKLMRSKALMHHRPYFQQSIVASVLVQSNPKDYLDLLSRQDFRSFPLIKGLIQKPLSINVPDCHHQSFAKSLEKLCLLAKYKMDPVNCGSAIESLKDVIEEEDMKMILCDGVVLHHFNPVQKHEDGIHQMQLLLADVFARTPVNLNSLLRPFSAKTATLLKQFLKNNQDVLASPTIDKVLEALPFTAEEVSSLIEAACETPLTSEVSVHVLSASLNKMCQVDKWSLANLPSFCNKAIANALERVLGESMYNEMLEAFLKPLLILIQINSQFGGLISATHISLACNNGKDPIVSFIETVFERQLKTHAAQFKKWIMKNMAAVSAFHKPVKMLLLDGDQCKPKFIEALGKHLIELDELKEDLEDLLSILVEKYQFDVSKSSLKPCRPLMLQAKSSQDYRVLVETIIIPAMKDCVKSVKSGNKILAHKSYELLKEALFELDHDLYASHILRDEWPSFMKSSLKHGLKSDCGHLCIGALDIICQNILNNQETFSEARTLYALICGHSQFVPTLFATSSSSTTKKEALLALILTLVKFDPTICSSIQVPIFLGAYNATLSLSDQTILEILYIHEVEGSVNLQAFKPLVWGQAAILKFSVSSKKSNAKISKAPKMSEILAAIQPEKMIASALSLPASFEQVNNENIYDPRFFLPLLCQLCSPDNFVDKHLKLIESGGLALAFASLSCRDEQVRLMGIVALHRIYAQLESARKSLSAEKQVWLHLVDILRNGLLALVADNKKAPRPPRIPHLTTAFLVKATKIISNPLDPMFKGVSGFILAKPMMDLFEVPEFLRLFHSSDVTLHTIEQEWMLSVIKDGLKDELDYGMLQQNFIVKMLLSFHNSTLGKESRTARSLILDIVNAMASMPTPALDLIRNHALVLWLLTVDDDYVKVAHILCSLHGCTKANLSSQTSLEMIQLALKLINQSDDIMKIALPIMIDLTDKIAPGLRDVVIDIKAVQSKASMMKDPEIDVYVTKLIQLV